MTQLQLEKLAELIGDTNKSIRIDLNNDSLTIKIQRNEGYVFFAVFGIIFSCLLLYFRKNSQINLEIGILILVLSTVTLILKQIPNKILIFNSITNNLIITPLFFLNKWILKTIMNTQRTVSFRSISEIKNSSSFINNQSRWELYIKRSVFSIVLFSFTDKEKTKLICNLLNQMRT
jgi:hypothetical protein